MKKIITLFAFAILATTTNAQSWLWAHEAQLTARNNEVLGTSINNNGDIFIAGYYQTSLNIGTATTLSVNFPGDYQNYVGKYNAAGVAQWLRNADPQQPDATAALEVSSDSLGNCYVASGNGYAFATAGSMFNYASSYGGFHHLQKLNSAGATQWSFYPSFASSSACTMESMKTDGTGNTYITGTFTGNVTFGSILLSSPGVSDVFVLCIDPSSFVVYAVQGTGNGQTIGHSIDIDYAGNAYVVGEFQSGLTLGTVNLSSNGGYDYFITKLGPTGNFIWAKSDGSASNDNLYGVAVDYPRIYVTGNFAANFTMGTLAVNTHGGQDILVACTDNNGNELWATANGGGSNDDIGYDIVADHNNGIYACGNYYGPATFGSTSVTGGNAAFLVKYDIGGTQQWVKKASSASMVVVTGKSLAANRNNEEAMGGSFNSYGGTIDFSGSTISLSCNGGAGNYGAGLYIAKVGNCSLTATASPNVTIPCGDSTVVTATGGTAWSWSPSSGLSSSTGASVYAYPVVTTTYTVTASDALGCSTTATVTVTVNGGPVIGLSGTTTICVGQSTTLTASGANTYVWSPATNVSNPNIANPVITPPATATYTVTGTNAFGCYNSTPVTITVNPLPTAPTITPSGAVLTSTTATTYQWYYLGSPIAGATNQNYIVLSNGIYTVTVTNIYGCTATSAPYNFTTVGLDAITTGHEEISIYPNPITDELNIQRNNNEPSEIIIYDLSSRKLIQQSITNATTINTTQLAKGMYLYTIRNKNGIIKNGMVIKE